MNAKTLKALKGSIKKWENIAKGTGEDKGHINCPLCQIFINIDGELCDECIISDVSGAELCENTPYKKWLYHHNLTHNPCFPHKIQPNCKECVLLAKAELKFLKSLLPKQVKK